LEGFSSLFNDKETRQKFFNVMGSGVMRRSNSNRRRTNQNGLGRNNPSQTKQRQGGRLGFIGGGGLLGRRRGRISPGAFNAGLGGRFGLYFPNAIQDN
jgi:hypothetical protein